MKRRVQAFTEGIVLMVCPVLLAVALEKADLKSKRNGLVGRSISPLAAATLEAGILPFLCLCLSKLPAVEALAGLLVRASTLLLHLCAVLLMALAYGILLLIDMDKYMYCLAGLVLAPLVPLTLWRCYLTTTRSSRDRDATQRSRRSDDDGDGALLENSVDFSAAVTALLFLGLEGLALEGQSISVASQEEGLHSLFTASLGVTYLTCALGVLIMLHGTVPPPITNRRNNLVVELLNIALAIAIGVVVVLITAAPLREHAWLVFVPLILSFVVWMYTVLAGGDDADGGQVLASGIIEELKPASLELTKVTFTGFLAVAVPALSKSTPNGSSTRGFILLSAAAVVSGIGWRLLTHRIAAPSPALVTAANVASFCAHICIAAAVIPFAAIAVDALNSSHPASGCHR